MADLEALVDTLARTVENLDQHIRSQAEEVAKPRIAEVQTVADARVAALEESMAVEFQRHRDLTAELRRQLAVKTRQAEQWRVDAAKHGSELAARTRPVKV